MNRIVLTLAVCLATTTLASSRPELLSRAAEEVNASTDELEEAGASCRKKLAPRLDALADAVRDAQKEPNADAPIRAARKAADQAADAARGACTTAAGKRLARRLDKASEVLDDALTAKAPAAPPPVFGAIAQGLGSIFNGGIQQSSQKSTQEYSKSSTTEQINGRDLEPDGEDAAPAAPARREKVDKRKEGPKAGEFGATCRNNSECDSNTCYTGAGKLGFCTKMCNEDDDCPRKMFEWSCYRPSGLNAPQKLCLQSN